MIVIDYKTLIKEFSLADNYMDGKLLFTLRSPDNKVEELTLTDIFDELFDGMAEAVYSDGGSLSPNNQWDYVPPTHHQPPQGSTTTPTSLNYIRELLVSELNDQPIVKIYNAQSNITWTLMPESYHVKEGDVVWWEKLALLGKDWEHVVRVTITNDLDNTILLVYQTYGDPHGSWDWDLAPLTIPAVINYTSIPI